MDEQHKCQMQNYVKFQKKIKDKVQVPLGLVISSQSHDVQKKDYDLNFIKIKKICSENDKVNIEKVSYGCYKNSYLSMPKMKNNITIWKTVCEFVTKLNTDIQQSIHIPIIGMAYHTNSISF